MKARIPTMLILLAAMGFSFAGCGSEKDIYLAEIIEVLPQEVYGRNLFGVQYVNAKSLSRDPDLVNLFKYFKERVRAQTEYILGIDLSDAWAYAEASGYDGWLTLVKGGFNPKKVRDSLKNHGYNESEYGGSEVWIKQYWVVTFPDNILVFGSEDHVKASISVINSEEPSMYDDENVKAVIDKIPTGIESYIYRGGIIYNEIPTLAGRLSTINMARGDNTLDMNGWYIFDSEATAKSALHDLEEYIRGWWFYYSYCHPRGRFIETTGEMGIEFFDIWVCD
jgi:hypothetical protein